MSTDTAVKTDKTVAILIDAIVLNVFSADPYLGSYGPYDRKIHMEDLRDTLKDTISNWVGRNGERE